MTDNYNQSAVTQVPAEVSSNGEQDILNRFRSFDELQDRVRNLPFSEFAGRYAPNNYEAAERIYAQVSNSFMSSLGLMSLFMINVLNHKIQILMHTLILILYQVRYLMLSLVIPLIRVCVIVLLSP